MFSPDALPPIPVFPGSCAQRHGPLWFGRAWEPLQCKPSCWRRSPLQQCKSKLLLSFLALFVASTKSFPSEFLKAKYPALHRALFNLYKKSKGIIFLCIDAFVFVLAAFLYFNYSLISTAPLLLPEVHFKAPKHELGAYKLQHESKQRWISESHKRAAWRIFLNSPRSQQAALMPHGSSLVAEKLWKNDAFPVPPPLQGLQWDVGA